jgi:hypothetical protein
MLPPGHRILPRFLTWLQQPHSVINAEYISDEHTWIVELANNNHQVLCFRLFNYHIQSLHHRIYFRQFTYAGDTLKKVETFDGYGFYAEEHEARDEAIITFSIEKPALFAVKKKLVEEAEYNINTADEHEKIVRIHGYNASGRLMYTAYISSSAYLRYSLRL